jgi:hypothetical protein
MLRFLLLSHWLTDKQFVFSAVHSYENYSRAAPAPIIITHN